MTSKFCFSRKIGFVALLASTVALPSYALAQEEVVQKDDKRSKVLERVMVIGTQDRREEIPGAASIVTQETLDRFQYTDVHRALREVPGVTVQEEDGHGLRPNIAIRGGRSNRSADITLMEDGVLSSPAPYAAPAAYYFPQMDRMDSLEVIKGAGSIKYGPRTTNGVLNMVTKPIPETKQADAVIEGGSFGGFRSGITTGTTVDNMGVMFNAFHKQSRGFKDIDFVGGDSGYEVQDIMGKFRMQTDASQDRYQELELKIGYYDETSNETYLGLTDGDFARKSNRRYGSSQLDEMNVDALQTTATHYIELTPESSLTTTLYRNEVNRAWYKLDGVTVGGVRRSIGSIFGDQAANAAYIDELRSANTTGDTFSIRNNSRSYEAYGVQSAVTLDYDMGDVANTLEVGMRFHHDEEDRFQRDDQFDMVGGRAVITNRGVDGTAGNRVVSANAWSGFVQNEFNWQKWTVTPGIRFEHIQLESEDYGNADPARSGSALDVNGNSLDVWIPGIGVSYAVNDAWSILGGVHKGFAPPGVPGDPNEAAFSRPEESINYEIGTRYAQGNWSGELFGFVTDYDNLLGRDTLATGGGGTGESYNGGQVQVMGIEAMAQYDAAQLAGLRNGYRLPLTVSYTLTDAEFKNSFDSSFGEWGSVNAGDELPYMPKHQLYLAMGMETDTWGVTVGGKYVDEMRAVAGSGSIPAGELMEAHWVVDAAGEYRLTDNIAAFATVQNVLDEDYVASRRPAGARPGMPLSAMAGVKISLW